MRSIKFDQLGRKGPVVPVALAPPAAAFAPPAPRPADPPGTRVPADHDAALPAGSPKP